MRGSALCLLTTWCLLLPGLAGADSPAKAAHAESVAARAETGDSAPPPARVAAGQAAPPAEPGVAQLDTIVVTGAQPGPGLWKVTQGEHVLWVLGTLMPLPRRMQWQSGEVEATLLSAQELLREPGVSINSKIGFFGRLALLPALLGVRENPGHVHLDTLLPAELHARWAALKAKYIGRNDAIERWRPILAAMKLYEAALKKTGLTTDDIVEDRLRKVAKKAGIAETKIRVTYEIKDPKAALKDFKRASLDDQDCLRRTLDYLESDLGAMTAAANAWATGDLAALRTLPLESQWRRCSEVLTEASFLRSRGVVDVEERVRQAWLDAARTSLERNQVTFALLPISELLRDDGDLARLCADSGCSIEAPDADDALPAETPSPGLSSGDARRAPGAAEQARPVQSTPERGNIHGFASRQD